MLLLLLMMIQVYFEYIQNKKYRIQQGSKKQVIHVQKRSRRKLELFKSTPSPAPMIYIYTTSTHPNIDNNINHINSNINNHHNKKNNKINFWWWW